MSKRDGGPAFPITGETDDDGRYITDFGMSLRDYFAGQVVAGWGEGYHCESLEIDLDEVYEERVARYAYQVADAMLAERDR